MPNLAKLKIGEFVFDPSRNLLSGAAGEVTLEAKVVDVLVALAAQPGVVFSRDELIDAVWKTEFGADERLTRAISMLRKAFHDERGTPRYIETVAKRGYRLVAAVERVAATNGAEANGATAGEALDPMASPAPADATSQPARLRPSRVWQATAAAGAVAALAVAGVAATVWQDPDSPASAGTQDVVQLSSLQVIDRTPGKDAFARQVHASLRRILASNRVALVDSSVKQPQKSSGDPLIDSEFTLSGLLEQIDDRYSVTLYFDNRQDGQTLWSQRFTRAVSQGEGLREEIGADAAYVIQCALGLRAAAPVRPKMEVLKAYLETCNPEQFIGDAGMLYPIAQRLIETAPDDAYGHALLALAYASSSGESGLAPAQLESYRAAARKSAARARELNPRDMVAPLAELWLVPGAEFWRQQDAYVKNWGLGHPIAVGGYVQSLRTSGRLNEAVRVIEGAVGATPLRPQHKISQAVLIMTIGDHEDADRLFAEVLHVRPDLEAANWYRFVNAAFYGDPDLALKLLNSSDQSKSGKACWRAFIDVRGRGGNKGDLGAVRKLCAGTHWSHQDYKARIFAALGDINGAYDLVRNRSFDWDGSTTFLFYPEMKLFRQDARFMSFVADSGLVEYWLRSGQWPDFCRDKDQTYDCKEAAARALQERRSARTNGVAAPSPESR